MARKSSRIRHGKQEPIYTEASASNSEEPKEVPAAMEKVAKLIEPTLAGSGNTWFGKFERSVSSRETPLVAQSSVKTRGTSSAQHSQSTVGTLAMGDEVKAKEA